MCDGVFLDAPDLRPCDFRHASSSLLQAPTSGPDLVQLFFWLVRGRFFAFRVLLAGLYSLMHCLRFDSFLPSFEKGCVSFVVYPSWTIALCPTSSVLSVIFSLYLCALISYYPACTPISPKFSFWLFALFSPLLFLSFPPLTCTCSLPCIVHRLSASSSSAYLHHDFVIVPSTVFVPATIRTFR